MKAYPILWVLLFLAAHLPAYCQKLAFKIYSTKDGLAHNEAQNIFQDSKGFLWIGTSEGLSRFDGASFQNITLESNASTNNGAGISTYVSRILEDENGTIWCSLIMGEGVLRINQAECSFTQLKVKPEIMANENWVYTIMRDSKTYCGWGLIMVSLPIPTANSSRLMY